MIDADLAAAFEATWPSFETARAGGFLVGRGLGGGMRVSSAIAKGPWTGADMGRAIAIHQGWEQRPLFRVDDQDLALTKALTDAGFHPEQPTAMMQIQISALTRFDVPPMSTFAIWPPLAIQREIWQAGHIGKPRQKVMERVNLPRTSLLGRVDDRAAGAAFVACLGPVAMIHAIEVDPTQRRKGVAGRILRKAAFWAAEQGAQRLALAVTRTNLAAVSLYRRIGFAEVGGYTYYAPPKASASD